MNKLKALFLLFRKGNEVADPEGWKNGQITANTIAGLIAAMLATSNAFGYALPVSDDAVLSIAGGVFAAANVVVTIITSKRAGLPAVPTNGEDGPTASNAGNPPDTNGVDYRG